MIEQTPWTTHCPKPYSRLVELEDRTSDPIAIYAERYKGPFIGLPRIQRYKEEIISEFKEDSSVLFLGAGHSGNPNFIFQSSNVAELTVLDYVKEAAYGLSPGIEFIGDDFRTTNKLKTYDYVFSEHTIEHFSRDDILNIVLPKCLRVAKDAVVFVLPYGKNWSDEKSHRCLFYEDDELSARCVRWKKIYNGQELILWFEGEAI
ncbi:hypothetical protein LCGC14_0747480 [marine sediment metagenome]|uniref:Methyltransferase type 11 domain-containing protein n=1 Tax=marine sediment metagenome TaxID=412755 RepID=A0A0F9Q951_9ZZZZ